MIDYEDFSLKIEPKQGEEFPVIVLSSPAGEGRSSFKLPFDPNEIGNLLFDLGNTVRSSSHVPLREVSPAATHTPPQKIGDQLFNALFSGSTRSLLDRSLGMIYGHQRGLRIKLHIDPEDPSLAQLASLPWEFLYRKETRDFLNLSRYTPILRYLDIQRPYTPLPLEPPLRILILISDPVDYVGLDLDKERKLIEASWAKQEGVQVEFMEHATIHALQDRLVDHPYHVLHYMGHGGFDERTGQGVLILEDENGQGAIVDGTTLGVLLRDLPTLRMVFLNACETARVTRDIGIDPFAGVAAAMVMAGIPAVVAMQFPVTDEAAITFSQKFYPLLAHGEPIDTAVAEGRLSVRLAESSTMEWGTPVLFMRAPQGKIFQVAAIRHDVAPELQVPAFQSELDAQQEQRLKETYTLGLSAFWLEEWDKAVRYFQSIVEVVPNYEDAADKLTEALRQSKLFMLYTRALAAQEAGDWAGALSGFRKLAMEAPDYRDTADRLETVKKQKQLVDLYTEAKKLHQAEQWQAVVNVFEKIFALEPDFNDPDGLLTEAEKELTALKRQENLGDIYSQGVRELNAGQWQIAQQLLTQAKEIEPDYQDTERLLARIEQEIEREQEETRRQERVAALYEQALAFAQAEQWQQVIPKMDEIYALDPEFVDREELVDRAREGLAKEEVEAEELSELDVLYAEAVELLNAREYQKALEKWKGVQVRNPNYPDRQNVESNASKKLESIPKDAQTRQRQRRWIYIAVIGGVILMGIFGIAYGFITNSNPEEIVETVVVTAPIVGIMQTDEGEVVSGIVSPTNISNIASKTATQPPSRAITPSPVELTESSPEPINEMVILPDLEGREITIAVENAYPPFNFEIFATGEDKGWDYDFIGEACALLNCIPTWVEISWDELISSVSAGQIDMSADGITITQERAEFVDFSKDYFTVRQLLMVRIDDDRFETSRDIDSYVVLGQVIDTRSYWTALDYVERDQIDSFSDLSGAVDALIAGDVEAIIVEEVEGQSYIQEGYQVKLVGPSLSDEKLGLIFPKGSDLVEPFNKVIEAFKENGTLERLNASWLSKTDQDIFDEFGILSEGVYEK